MVKYRCQNPEAQRYLDILDYNKFKAGFLNRQIIILLKTLGIRETVFE
jgi:RNA-dependent RNA polymerase